MSSTGPHFLALFQKRIDGDDALLELTRIRFKEAGMGAEFYAGTPDELDHLLQFLPWPDAPVIVHLPREMDLFEEEHRRQFLHFAASSREKIYGFVIHDQTEIKTHHNEYFAALREINSVLRSWAQGPYLFVEYAVGLAPELYCELFKKIRELEKVSACIDISHIGIRQARDIFQRKHTGQDICALDPSNPLLPEIIADVEDAVHGALPMTLTVIHRLAGFGKPLHFHLHDGHPLSTYSPFGVSDHLSFFEEIPIPFSYNRKKSLQPMFGPSGLKQVVTESLQILGPDLVSYTLEIHPTQGRIPLGNAAYLFEHWQDKTHAEQLDYWLSVLLKNHKLLQKTIRDGIR